MQFENKNSAAAQKYLCFMVVHVEVTTHSDKSSNSIQICKILHSGLS